MTSPASGLPAYTMPPTSGAGSPGWGLAGASGTGPSPWGHPADAPADRPGESPGAADDSSWSTPGGPVWDNPDAAPAPSGPSWNAPSGNYSPAGGHRPAPAAQVSTSPAPAGTYGAGSVPQQRGEGTVYGGAGNQSPIDMTMPVSMNPVENSGSLTGHILAQGWDFGADTGRRSNVKVGIAMLVVLLVLIGISVLFLFTAGEAFTDMLNGVLGKD
jgi:hypothetical protein